MSALRALLDAPGLVTVPGCFDALGARLVEQAGFEAVYMTGFGTSATLLAQPDLGLVGRDDMVATVARIAAATTLPVIADADTGFGDAASTAATVRDYERAGAAAIQLEDQVSPKRCGHMADKSVVPVSEMVAKLEAAVAARGEMLVVARTDARAPEGLGAAIERAHRYVEAGADVLFVEALESVEESSRSRSNRSASRSSTTVSRAGGRRCSAPARSRSSGTRSCCCRSRCCSQPPARCRPPSPTSAPTA